MSNIIYPFDNDFAYEIKPNTVFVFPSRHDGLHGKGASYLAIHKFGAKRGVSKGHHNNSVAICVENEDGDELEIESIRTNIRLFVIDSNAKHNKHLNENIIPFEYIISDFSKELKEDTFKNVASAFSKVNHRAIFPVSFSKYVNPNYIVDYDNT
jgi:hypothetical protein